MLVHNWSNLGVAYEVEVDDDSISERILMAA